MRVKNNNVNLNSFTKKTWDTFMPVFICKLGDDEGRIVEKEIVAIDLKSLNDTLEKDGFFAYKISRKKANISSLVNPLKVKRIKTDEFLIFNSELSALLKAGLPLLASLEILSDTEKNMFFKDLLQQVTKAVKEGSAFSDALNLGPSVFSNLYVTSIRAGEKSGDIVTNIKRYIGYTKRVEELKKSVIQASVYPVILMSVAIIVIMFLLLYVVPSFSQIYVDSGTDLPMPTQILINITDFIKDNFIFIMIFIFLSTGSLTGVMKSGIFDRSIGRFKITLPWLGDTIKKYSLAKFFRTLSTVLRSGTPLPPSLTLSTAVLDNLFMEEKMTMVIQRVKEGERLAEAIDDTGFVPVTAIKMIMVGETSGSLDNMFENVAELFEEQIDRRIKVVTTLIEPVLMLSMGLIVAFIVVAMYLPIFKLAGSVD